MSRRHIVMLGGNALAFALLLAACGQSGTGAVGSGGTRAGTGGSGTGGSVTGTGGSVTGTGGSVTGTGGIVTGSGGTVTGTGGTVTGTGGSVTSFGGSMSGSGGALTGTGGAVRGSGGTATGSGGRSVGGTTGTRPAGGTTGASQGGTSGGTGTTPTGTGGCVMGGTWPTVDPASAGPYAVTLEENIGPTAGTENAHFDVIRPTDLAKTDLCHPLITWGNGHGDNPPTYMVLLKQLASHGFVVVASLTKTASQGTPLPQIAGIDWILQENDKPDSIYYRRIDTVHIGATGHSEGGMATSKCASDTRVKAVATICGWVANSTKQCPGLYLCGGQDTMATCTGMQSAFDSTAGPLIWAEQLSASHGSWIGSIKDPFMIAVTGWFRYHLMGDTAQKKMFYGTDCTICTDTAKWKVLGQKGMDP
jgi:hypothetical protein